MHAARYLFVLCLLAIFHVGAARLAQAEETVEATTAVDGSDLQRFLMERRTKVNQLTSEERTLLREARKEAVNDPDVQAAVAKRNRAIVEFRAAVRAAILKSDPSVAPILEKLNAARARERRN